MIPLIAPAKSRDQGQYYAQYVLYTDRFNSIDRRTGME